MIVIADTAPINYLVLIGEAQLLHTLYGEVVIPPAVLKELLSSRAPELVRKWAEAQPPWVRVHSVDPEALADLADTLDPGEREAIAVARILRADLVVIDERAGRREARRWNLSVTGTLGVLLAAADRGFIDLHQALERLQRTNFYMSPKLRAALLGSR